MAAASSSCLSLFIFCALILSSIKTEAVPRKSFSRFTRETADLPVRTQLTSNPSDQPSFTRIQTNYGVGATVDQREQQKNDEDSLPESYRTYAATPALERQQQRQDDRFVEEAIGTRTTTTPARETTRYPETVAYEATNLKPAKFTATQYEGMSSTKNPENHRYYTAQAQTLAQSHDGAAYDADLRTVSLPYSGTFKKPAAGYYNRVQQRPKVQQHVFSSMEEYDKSMATLNPEDFENQP